MNDLSISRLSLLAAEIDAEYRAAYVFAGEAVKHAAECGRLLLEAKALLPHGDWIPWLKANTEVIPRQSQRYMRLASNWEAISKSVPGGTHLSINTALALIADPRPKPQPKQRCISAAEIGEVTLIHRGWIPDFTPKGGGGPWPSDIAAFYAERGKVGPPLEVLAWQKKAAKFHWRDWLPNSSDAALLKFRQAHAERERQSVAERERQAEAERERQAEAEKKRCPHCGGVLS